MSIILPGSNDRLFSTTSFILRFLNEASKLGIESVSKNDLVNYVSYILSSNEYDDIVGFKTKVGRALVEEVIDKIPSPYYLVLSSLDDDLLILQKEELEKHSRAVGCLNGEDSLDMKYLVNGWERFKENIPDKKQKVTNLKVYDTDADSNYVLTTTKKLGFLDTLKMGLTGNFDIGDRLELVTDGGAMWYDLERRPKENNSLVGSGFYVPQYSRRVKVFGSSFTIVQGYVDRELAKAKLYTRLKGESLVDAMEIAATISPGERQTDEFPHVRLLKKL